MFEQLELFYSAKPQTGNKPSRGKTTHIRSDLVLRGDSRKIECCPRIMKPKGSPDFSEESIDDIDSTAQMSETTVDLVNESLDEQATAGCQEIEQVGSLCKALSPLDIAADGELPLASASSPPPCISPLKCKHQDEDRVSQVPTPQRDRFNHYKTESPDRTQNKTARYSLFCDDTTSPEHALTRFKNTTLSLTPELTQVEKGGDEPMEYFLLDYLDSLPAGFTNKLRESFDVHEELVRHLCKKNEKLQSKAREREIAGDAHVQTSKSNVVEREPQNMQESSSGTKPRSALTAGTPTSATTCVTNDTSVNGEVLGNAGADSLSNEKKAESDVGMAMQNVAAEACGRQLRANKIAVAQEEHLRLGAEAHEAMMRSKLEQTCKAAKERIAAMTRRAEREEEECQVRASTAKHERERMQLDLEAVQREQVKAKAQIVELEAAIRTANDKCKEKEKARRACAQEIEATRNELKAHRVRATKSQQIEQRVRDMERELQATLAAIARTTNVANP